MEIARKIKLEKNFFKIFFINALLNVKTLNIVVSLFYVFRGLEVAQIFYLGAIYSVTVVCSEIPSSYLADRFGRKRTIIMAGFFGLLYWSFYLIADSFYLFAIGVVFYALAESCMSGTDEAFVYDTNKELGNHSESLKKLSRYFSSERVFKIVSVLVGVFIAKDLAGWQFNLIITIDIVASFFAIITACTLVEPNHYVDLEKQEAGLIKDSYKIISRDKRLLSAIFSKILIFNAASIIWFYFSLLFYNLGVSMLVLGISFSLFQAMVFGANHMMHLLWPNKSDQIKINILNIIFFFSIAAFIGCWFLYPQKYILLFIFIVSQLACSLRDPMFSHIFNKQFNSYNRATALSLASFLRHILIIPLLSIVGWLVGKHFISPYVVALVLALIVIIYFRIKPEANLYEPKVV